MQELVESNPSLAVLASVVCGESSKEKALFYMRARGKCCHDVRIPSLSLLEFTQDMVRPGNAVGVPVFRLVEITYGLDVEVDEETRPDNVRHGKKPLPRVSHGLAGKRLA